MIGRSVFGLRLLNGDRVRTILEEHLHFRRKGEYCCFCYLDLNKCISKTQRTLTRTNLKTKALDFTCHIGEMIVNLILGRLSFVCLMGHWTPKNLRLL